MGYYCRTKRSTRRRDVRNGFRKPVCTRRTSTHAKKPVKKPVKTCKRSKPVEYTPLGESSFQKLVEKYGPRVFCGWYGHNKDTPPRIDVLKNQDDPRILTGIVNGLCRITGEPCMGYSFYFKVPKKQDGYPIDSSFRHPAEICGINYSCCSIYKAVNKPIPK